MGLLAYPARGVLFALQVNNKPSQSALTSHSYMFRFYETIPFYYMFEKYPKNRAATSLSLRRQKQGQGG